jgi:hypothetical protein
MLASQSAAVLPNVGPLLPNWLTIGLLPRQLGDSSPAAVEPEGPFVLQSAGGGSRSFRTLKAAVADARSGDLILLRYNGLPDTLPAQPPIRVNGMNLIIRAAEGFRPTLEFDGRQEGTVQPGQMISLRGNGSLTLRDVDVRLIARNDSTTDRWSLFQCAGAGRLSLENVSLELINPDRQPASLFDLTDDAAGAPPTGVRELTDISLTRVIARADADAFRIAAQPRARLQILNSGLALQGTLASIPGDSSMQLTRGTVELSLDHVTCLHGGPLIAMRDSDDRTARAIQRLLPSLAVRSEACVFAVAGGDRQLLLSRGNSYLEDMERLVSWTGSTNLYDGHAVFWFFESSAVDFASRRLDFLQWRLLWSQRSDSEETRAAILPSLAWKNPGWKSQTASMTSPAFTREAFELDSALFIPTARSLPLARDGLIPGVNPVELPAFPERSESAVVPSTAGTDTATATLSASASGSPAAASATPAIPGVEAVNQPATSTSGPNR